MTSSAPGQYIFGPLVRTACRVLLVLAAVGLIASLIVHVLAWVGVRVLGEPSLFIGLFVVWVPTVLVSRRLTEEHPQKDFWKTALRWCPRWASPGTMLLFGYAFVSFTLSLFSSSGRTPDATDPVSVRTFSAMGMAFYGAATAVLYSAVHAVDDRPRCPSGHVASPKAAFCDKCGSPAAPAERSGAPRSFVR